MSLVEDAFSFFKQIGHAWMSCWIIEVDFSRVREPTHEVGDFVFLRPDKCLVRQESFCNSSEDSENSWVSVCLHV